MKIKTSNLIIGVNFEITYVRDLKTKKFLFLFETKDPSNYVFSSLGKLENKKSELFQEAVDAVTELLRWPEYF